MGLFRKKQKIGYACVCKNGEVEVGTSLQEQELLLTLQNCDCIVTETYSPTSTRRPKFASIVHSIRKGDTLVVSSLDRISKSAESALKLIEELLQRKAAVYIVNIGIISKKKEGKKNLQNIKAFAEFEKQCRLERQIAGKQTQRNSEANTPQKQKQKTQRKSQMEQ